MVGPRPNAPAPDTPFWLCLPGADPHKIPIDPNGNLAAKTEGSDNWTYSWNAENQLTRVTKNTVEQASFAYDPLGRRVEKVAGGVTTSYTYDREDILREVRGATTLKYVHGPKIDEPLAQEDGSGTLTYYHVDSLGSVMKMTNAAGAVTLTRQYDAWGNLETGASEPGYAFTGREWDLETRLYYYRARYYDAATGRFVSADPIGIRAGPNLYAYVNGSPTNADDPSGLVNVNTIEHVTTYPNMPPGCWIATASGGYSSFSCTLLSYSLDVWCDGCGNLKTSLTLTADIRVMEGPYPPIGPNFSTTEEGIAHERAHVRHVANLSEAFLSTFEKSYGSYEACAAQIPIVRASYAEAFKLFGGYSQNLLQ